MENIEPYLYIFWAQDKPKMIRNMLAALEKGQDNIGEGRLVHHKKYGLDEQVLELGQLLASSEPLDAPPGYVHSVHVLPNKRRTKIEVHSNVRQPLTSRLLCAD